jgi:holo-ACP synthase
MNKKINPIDILNARENRVYLQESLSEKYKLPSIAIRANYPGLYKNNPVANDITCIMKEEILKIFAEKIKHIEIIDSWEGLVYILFVDEKSLEIKREVVHLEEKHPLGRLVDIDVYRKDGLGISRSELKLQKRKCFICQNDAHVCVRSKAHSLEEILDYIHSSYSKFKNNGGGI